MATTNHWGVWVDSETPITGVLNVGDVAWEWVNDETCLTCDEIQAEFEAEQAELPEDEREEEFDFECDSAHTKIFGDWLLDEASGKYEPDKNGEFAAISNEMYVQVVFSKTTVRRALCAPTFPGQADLDTPGDFLCYALPAYLTE